MIYFLQSANGKQRRRVVRQDSSDEGEAEAGMSIVSLLERRYLEFQ